VVWPGLGVVTRLQSGQPVQADLAYPRRSQAVTELEIQLAPLWGEVEPIPSTKDPAVEGAAERPVDRGVACLHPQRLRDRDGEPIAVARQSAAGQANAETAAVQHRHISKETGPPCPRPGQPEVRLAEQLEARAQPGAAGEPEEGGRCATRQTERTATAGIEHPIPRAGAALVALRRRSRSIQ
jgi:hypothetical protein